jgi:GNAT superfamily N-acetyltransferase
VRQPERAARQGRLPHVPAPAGGRIDVRALTPEEVERVDAALPLSRLDHVQTYLVAWDGDEPVGHAHLAWTGSGLGVPEVQDVFVVESRRRSGIGTALMAEAERLVAAEGHRGIGIGHSIDNEAARRLYEGLGYRDAGLPPTRVQGSIVIRGAPIDVDDTIVYLVRDLPVDFGPARSS